MSEQIDKLVNDIFKKYDRNDDQQLSFHEAKEYLLDNINWHSSFNVQKLFAFIDSNSNNQITKSELKVFLKDYVIG